MKTRKYNYKKPRITLKKLKLNRFLRNRVFDSIESFIIPDVFAQTCCSCSGYCSPACFLKNTHIELEGKKSKPIQDIQVGDSILSYNSKSKKLVKRKVASLKSHKNLVLEYITINHTISVSTNHILWINNFWQPARLLQIGDAMLSLGRKQIKVKSIKIGKIKSDWYDLQIQGEERNYFAESILAHNK